MTSDLPPEHPSTTDRHASKIARMIQPESLRSEEYQPWSRGRGVDVWAMLCASIMGDLDTISALVARDPALVECEYEYFKPIRFAVRENHPAVVEFLLKHGADSAYEAGDSLVGVARDRGYAELVTFLEAIRKERYYVAPKGVQLADATCNHTKAPLFTGSSASVC
jgi:uncharacterized protein